MPRYPEFGAVDFDGEYPHPRGKIPIKYLGKSPNGEEIIKWGIRQGTSYPPERHPHSHLLIIISGSGRLSIDGKEMSYAAGRSYHIAGNVPHGFVDAHTTTPVMEIVQRA